MNYKVIITTSGIGSRLGEVTRFINKALVRVGKKAAISYIIEKIPLEVPIVITLGYKKDQVKEYLLFAHPERVFEFVDIYPFEGERSSLGYSLLSAAPTLQCPFIYVACDTLFSFPLEVPSYNWMAVVPAFDAGQYTSVKISYKNYIQEIYAKGAIEFDSVYIGLAGIVDYGPFWENLKKLYFENPVDQTLNDTRVFSEMLRQGYRINPHRIEKWFDIGNQEALQNARNQIDDYFDNLEKADESIYLFDDDFVIKFFFDHSIIKKRVARASYLKGLVPNIEKVGYYFYRYEYIQGELYSQIVNRYNLKSFLIYCQVHLWHPKTLAAQEAKIFQTHCENFYYQKSLARIAQFYQASDLIDQVYTINRQEVPPLGVLLDQIDWPWLTKGRASGFHGDLHFENVLSVDEKFYFLDWRQDFDGLIEYGDTYYDLAKLNHGMIISHEIVRKNLFEIEINGNNVNCEILRPDSLVLCQEEFYNFLRINHFDVNKVEILTALIFLNIAPLHHHPYNMFLHFFGRLRLWDALNHTMGPTSAKDRLEALIPQ